MPFIRLSIFFLPSDKTPWKEANSNPSTMTRLLGGFPEKHTTAEMTKPTLMQAKKENNDKTSKFKTTPLNNQRQNVTTVITKRKREEKRPAEFRYQGARKAENGATSRAETKWNEVKIPISNMKTSGYYKLYYPGE